MLNIVRNRTLEEAFQLLMLYKDVEIIIQRNNKYTVVVRDKEPTYSK